MTKYLSAACAVLCLSTALFSTPNPITPFPGGAGIIERELEKEYGAHPFDEQQEVPVIQIDIPEERMQLPEGKKVSVEYVSVQGNCGVSTKEINHWIECWLSDFEKKELSLKEIYDLCYFLEQKYVKKGYFLARFYPPPQKLGCKLTLEVIEGCLGCVQLEGNKFYSKDFILSYFCSLKNRPVNYRDFMRALMLLNDNKDMKASAIFQKGKEFGTVDVILKIDDSMPTHLYLNGNNYGRFLTTNTRIGGRFDWGSLATFGDQLSVAGVLGFPVKALYFYDLKYTVPLNRKGAFLQFSYLYSKFHIEELLRYRLKGQSQIGTVRFNQALVRRQTFSCDLFTYFDYKQVKDYVLGKLGAYDKLRVLTFGSVVENFGYSGRDYLNVRVSGGIPNLFGGLKAIDPHCSRPGGGGRFFVLNADYDHLHSLAWDCFFQFHTSLQVSPYKLTLPQIFYIGGVDSVRGFPLAVALGDSGYYCNFELRFPPLFLANEPFFNSRKKKWKDILQFDVFLDQGGAFLQSEYNTFLWGSGAGIRILGPWNLSTSFDVGFPLNHRDLTRGAFFYLKITSQPF